MISARDIELRIRTRDMTGGSLDAIRNKTAELANEFERLNRDTKSGVNNTSEFREAMGLLGREIDRQVVSLARLNADQDRHLRKRDELSARLVKEQAELARLQQQYDRTNNTTLTAQQNLDKYATSITKTQAAIEQENAAITKNNALLEQAGLSTRELVQNDQQLNQVLGQSNVLLRQMEQTLLTVPRVSREAQAELKKQATDTKALAQAEKERADTIQRVTAAANAAQRRAAEEQQKRLADQAKREQEFSQMQLRLEVFRRQQQEQAQARTEQAAKRANDSILAAQKRFNDARTRQEQEFTQIQMRLETFRRRQAQQAADEAARAAAVGTGGGAGGRAGGRTPTNFIGLRPDQMTNLTYQGFDIVQQLGSGQAAGIIALQQGSQILQLFTTRISTLLPMLPALAAGIAAVAVAGGALASAFREIGSNREMNAMLTLTGNNVEGLSERFTALRREMRGLGINWAESGTIIREGITAGVRPEQMRSLIVLARQLADVTGKDVTAAAKDVTTAFANNYDGIVQLNKQYPVLKAEQLDEIRLLYEQGKAADGAALAWKRFTDAGAAAGPGAVGPFTAATRELTGAWEKFTEELGKTEAIANIVKLLNDLAGGINAVAKAVKENPQMGASLVTGGSAAVGAVVGGLLGIAGGPPGILAGIAIGGSLGAGGGAYATSPGSFTWPGARRGPTQNVGGEPNIFNTLTVGPNAQMTPQTETIQKIVEEALQRMEPGTTGVITSAQAARKSGTPNHPAGIAVDVKLLLNGKEVPGFMGADVSGTYQKLWENMLKVAQEKFPQVVGQLASGTEFGTPDAGHFDLGGRRGRGAGAGATAAGAGAPGGPPMVSTAAQLTAARAAAEAAQRQYDIQFATTEQAERDARLAQRRAEIAQQITGTSEEEQKLRERMLKTTEDTIKAEQWEKRRQFTDDLARARITDGKNAEEIAAAGLRHMEAMQKASGNMLSIDKQRAAIQAGMANERARLQREDAATEQARQITNQLATMRASITGRDRTDLDTRMRAVEDSFQGIRSTIARARTNLQGGSLPADIDEQVSGIERLKKSYETAKFYQDQINDGLRTRKDLIEAVNTEVEIGAKTIGQGEEEIRKIYADTAETLGPTIEKFREFLKDNKDLDPVFARKLNAELTKTRYELEYISPLWKTITETFSESFGTGLTTAFNTIAEAIGGVIAQTKSWGDVLRSVKDAAINFFAQLLRDIANAIIKYEALKIASMITGGGGEDGEGGLLKVGLKALGILGSAATGTPALGTAAAAGTGGLYHQGGVVGLSNGGSRMLPAGAWLNAPRYHNGTVVGLSPGEQRAILQQGEEVLSRDNPRNVMNGGGTMGGINIRSILVDDPDRVPAAMASSQGERIVIQHLVKNAATVRQLVK